MLASCRDQHTWKGWQAWLGGAVTWLRGGGVPRVATGVTEAQFGPGRDCACERRLLWGMIHDTQSGLRAFVLCTRACLVLVLHLSSGSRSDDHIALFLLAETPEGALPHLPCKHGPERVPLFPYCHHALASWLFCKGDFFMGGWVLMVAVVASAAADLQRLVRSRLAVSL